MKVGILAVVVGMAGLAQPASAFTFTERAAQPTVLATYCRSYVPATFRVNTRGRLMSAQRTGWVVAGDTVTRVRTPAVYFQTRTLVEADHYTLTPC